MDFNPSLRFPMSMPYDNSLLMYQHQLFVQQQQINALFQAKGAAQ